MATIKFKDASPYTKARPAAPVDDKLFAKFMRDIRLDENKQSEKPVNVALFGVGRAGTIHLDSLMSNKRANLLYIVDDDITKHTLMKSYWNLKDVKVITNKDRDMIFKDPKIDAVIVSTPTFTHEKIVLEALANKKAVFCEKPIAQSRKNAQNCYEQARKVGKPLFCAFNRRFDSTYSTVRDRVHSGEVGHVHTLKVCSRDSPLPSLEYLKTSGGIFHDCSVHDLDMMCWVLGEYPIRVSSTAVANIPEIKAIDDFDTVSITCEFASGSIGVVDLSRNSPFGYDQRLEVFGPKGMIRARNEQPKHGLETRIGVSGTVTPPIWYSYSSRYYNAYKDEMEHFLDIVLGKATPKVNSHDVLAVSKIASAAEESARTGKFVDLTWSADEIPKI